MSSTAGDATRKAQDAGRKAQDAGRRAEGSDGVDLGIRAGLVAYGVVHLALGWLALQLALGDREGTPSQTGAVKELAQQPFGGALVWAVGIGMFLLVAWQVLEAAVGHREEEGKTRVRKRVTSVVKAVVYAVIGVSAIKVAIGARTSSSNDRQSDTWTAEVMSWPGGQVLIVIAGLAVVGVGAYLVHKAWSEGFRKYLAAGATSGEVGQAYVWFGKAGYTAKGVALAIVGGLFVYAGATHDAQKSGGLDTALQKVLQQPYGPFLLGLIAVGIICFGLFCFARARHLSR